ncbi:protein tyrosine kinase [Nocardia terpenica]|uniref:GNVR domain-containing protein n=1 Tax=Nocardia terpenica TaxID=455432 RepID=UPI001893D2CF|nr:GNVR domain-containing protein [Nocardia terpenica]MBF6064257.1 protein tyrosine kinase [Nocardia terpenica]MBF6106590.1 protein tyrosine kinase [Nocardia terpenica]MBF6113875.1 protein tyrosine kinase [Nocardia terpenica]MBF6120501.1 protein tyrosine kinase [Nocardia terpenica]MBF6154842.1 protein tyrosine kinase [Nocardia terpenica]
MGLIDLWQLLRRRWAIVAVGAVLCLAASYGYLKTLPVTYTASSTCYVSMATGTSVNDSYQGGLAAQQRVRSYLALATSVTVAQRVKDQLGLPMSVDELRGRVSAASPPATAVIVVSAHDGTADGARRITDEVVSQFRHLVDQLETIQPEAAPAARVAVVDKAQLPGAPSSPQRSRILVLGLLAGLVLGSAAAFARDRLDRRLRTSTDLAALAPVPILGIVDDGRPGAPGELRRLRTRLGDDPDTRTVLLTPLSRESLPELAIGLSRTLADTGDRVVLVDADTTGHGSSTHAPVRAETGLAELLRDSSPLDNAIVAWPEAGISMLPLGVIDSRTPDLLSSRRFAEIMTKLRTDFDHIVVEAAPVTAAADALALARRCDATIGVVELGPTTGNQVRGALATFGEGNARLVGIAVFSRQHRSVRNLLRRRGRRE